jgi:hypothetical protein
VRRLLRAIALNCQRLAGNPPQYLQQTKPLGVKRTYWFRLTKDEKLSGDVLLFAREAYDRTRVQLYIGLLIRVIPMSPKIFRSIASQEGGRNALALTRAQDSYGPDP